MKEENDFLLYVCLVTNYRRNYDYYTACPEVYRQLHTLSDSELVQKVRKIIEMQCPSNCNDCIVTNIDKVSLNCLKLAEIINFIIDYRKDREKINEKYIVNE